METIASWIATTWGWIKAAAFAFVALFAAEPPQETAFAGYVEVELTRISAPSAGTLAAVAVARGDAVQAGQLLAQLDATAELAAVTEARARVTQAQAQLADLTKGRRTPEIDALQAQRTQAEAAFALSDAEYRRLVQLVAEGIQTPRSLDAAKAAYDRDRARISELDAQIAAAQLGARDDQVRAAQALVNALRATAEQAEFRLSQRTVSAPFNARVVDTIYATGEVVPAAAPIVTLQAPGKVKVRFFVPESELASLRIGATVRIGCDGCAPERTARVTYIAPQAEFTPPVIFSRENRGKLSFLVEAVPDDAAGLHAGLPVEVARP